MVTEQEKNQALLLEGVKIRLQKHLPLTDDDKKIIKDLEAKQEAKRNLSSAEREFLLAKNELEKPKWKGMPLNKGESRQSETTDEEKKQIYQKVGIIKP